MTKINKECQNIYIVDDILENIQVLGKILVDHGYNIQVAHSGEQLLTGIQKKIPDLILLDVSMPGMDGYEVCRTLKKKDATKDIPVIFLTARTDKDDIIKGFKAGGIDYITKPFHADELLIRVNTHLQLKQAHDLIKQQKEDLQQKNDELYSLSITDGLTKIHNRLFFMDILKKEFSRSQRHSADLSCILFDLDHFKIINDTYGHLTGDYVLKETARHVKTVVREEDYLARYGGEEFIILLPDTGIDQAYTVAEKIRKIIEASQFSDDDTVVSVSISLGVSSSTSGHPENEEQLVHFADTALYQAKNSGRNCTIVYGNPEYNKTKS